jgi:hypothetical protein
MRYSFDGFFDRTAEAGPIRITNTPGNHIAIAKYERRMARSRELGKWRKSPASWKKNKGTYIDPEWYLVDYGQHG